MSFSPMRALADAGALWRRDRDLLVRAASIFFFLPALAMLLFLPDGPQVERGAGNGGEVLMRYLTANAQWLLLEQVVELFGVAVLLVLYLRPERPPLGDAMGQAARLFPRFLLNMGAGFLLTFGGLLLFLMPGFYVAGRTFLVGPAVVAERLGDPLTALERGFRLTHRQGWAMFALLVLGTLPSQVISLLVGAIAAAGGNTPLLVFVTGLVAAAASAGTLLALTLLRIVAYRRVTGSNRGT